MTNPPKSQQLYIMAVIGHGFITHCKIAFYGLDAFSANGKNPIKPEGL